MRAAQKMRLFQKQKIGDDKKIFCGKARRTRGNMVPKEGRVEFYAQKIYMAPSKNFLSL